MKQEDLLKCPLLQGLDAMHRAELLGLLNDSNLRAKLETCLAEHQLADPKAQPACVGAKAGNFEKDVHTWEPNAPLWRRSSKE